MLMLSRYTNNKLKSTISGCEPSKRIVGNFTLFSAVFMHPVSDMPLNCLENCIDTENPKQFEDHCWWLLYERLVDLGLIKNNP
jgi:isopenicillin N synthase-like dioxygenase